MTSGNKLAVYTAIFGGYDPIRPVLSGGTVEWANYWMVAEPSVEDIHNWKRYPTADFDYDNRLPRMRSRFFKMNPNMLFPSADITIWHGGNIQLNINPQKAVDMWLGDADMALFKHPHRNCVYSEARTLLEMGKGVREPIEQLVMFLSHIGYPKGNGLAACWFIIRRNNKRMRLFNARWWKTLHASGTERDQLLFNYVLWKSKDIKVKYIPGDLLTSPHFKYHKH